MDIKIFNKTLIPTEKELKELIGIANLLSSKDVESCILGHNLFKSSLYFKRTKKYKCLIKYHHRFGYTRVVYKTIRNISQITVFIYFILKGIGKEGYDVMGEITKNDQNDYRVVFYDPVKLIEICNA